MSSSEAEDFSTPENIEAALKTLDKEEVSTTSNLGINYWPILF